MAGNTRFHSKFHYAQHHSEVTSKNATYPDATTDPIASANLPFQGDFHSDGVLKITSLDATRFNYFGNDVHIDSNLRVTNNTTISGDLEVVGNVVLKANPALVQEQRIQIGDDKGGIDQIVDLVVFESYLDSDFTPLSSLHVNLGEAEKRWWNLYVTNIDLDGAFKIGTCAKDGQAADKGLFIDAGNPEPLARLGINTCEPNREFDLVGDMEIHGDIKLDDHKSVYWDSLSAGNTKSVGLSGSPDRLTMEHPVNIEFSSPNWRLERYDVDIKLKDSENALTIGDCLMHFDEKNNFVGVHTCNPTVDFDIVGNYQLSGGTAESYLSERFLVKSVGDSKIQSTINDVELFAGKNVNIVAADIGKSAQGTIVSTAGASHVMNAPTIMTNGNRLNLIATQYVKIATDSVDVDSPEIDLSTQDTSIKLKDSEHALNVHECMVKLDTTNRHVGINKCTPTVDLDVAGDVLLTAPNSVVVDSTGSINLSSGGYSSFEGGNVGINTRTPARALHVTGDEPVVAIGSSNDYFPRLDILDKGTTDIAGSLYLDQDIDTLKLTRTASRTATDGLVIDPDGKIGIGTINPSDTLHVVGTTFLNGTLKTSGTVEDQTLIPDRVVFKDNDTLQNTTTDEFYYDGVRAAIGHLPTTGEDAMLYVAKGPVKLASSIGKEMTITSTSSVDTDGQGARDTSLIEAPEDHSLSLDVPHNDTTSAFALRFREETATDGVYDSSKPETKLLVRPNQGLGRAFFGFNTTSQTVADDSSGFTDYDVIINQNVNINNNLRVANDLHVENDAKVDGMLTVNSESETTGVEVRGTGARVDLVDTVGGIDHRYELQSHKDMSNGEVPGTGSTRGSTISNATDDHLVLDLRNTSEDHRFALRYSSQNDGVADTIAIAAGQYDGETIQGHVGVNCIPTKGYHLDVNGNMRITGNFVVDGASTQIQAANLEVEDKNITLNITPGGTSTTASTFNAGLLILGDNNDVVGYVKVHPTNVDQLVAKAPGGQELNIDVNGSQVSTLRIEDSTINHKQSTHTLDNSQLTVTGTTSDILNSTIDVDNSNLSAKDATVSFKSNTTLDLDTGSAVNVGTNAQLHAEADTISRINQDLTTDSTDAQLAGLNVTQSLIAPTSDDDAQANSAGSVRYNQTTDMFEGNVGSDKWVPFSGTISDNDGDTYIRTKDNGDTDNDEIEFYVDGERVLYMNKEKAEFTTKYGFTIPSGPTEERPPDNIVNVGSFRFNTEHNHFEGYNGTSWVEAGGVIDADRDTYWTAHEDNVDTGPGPTIFTGALAARADNGGLTVWFSASPGAYITQSANGWQTQSGDFVVGSEATIGGRVYEVMQVVSVIDGDPGEEDEPADPQRFAIRLGTPHVGVTPNGAVVTLNAKNTSSYPGDPDVLRAFTADTQALEIGNNTTKFFNAGVEHLDITSPVGGFTRFTSTGMIDLNPGGDVNIHQHGGGKGLRLGNTLVTSSAEELNRSDITTVGHSENNKVLTQSNTGVVTIGDTNGNEQFNIKSHDGDTGGLLLNSKLVTSSADQLNFLDIDQAGAQDSLKKSDLEKLANINAHETQINWLTTPGLSQADFAKLAAINASAAEINDLHNNAVDASDFTKLSQVTSNATELNYLDGSLPGMASSTRALVLGNSKNITGLGSVSASSITSTGSITAGASGISTSGPITGGTITGGAITGTTGSFSSNVSSTGNGSFGGTLSVTGNVTGSANAFFSGEVHSSSTSDERLKRNLKKIENPLEKLDQISGYNFDWDTEAAAVSELAGADVGVVAQEVEKVLPEAVTSKDSGYKGVKYEKLIPLLIECVKDQQKQIDDLKSQLGQ